jgi:hypothetical protein
VTAGIRDSFAVLVVSCDRYQDLWKVFFYFFHRSWPRCPFPLYLISNSQAFESPGVVNVRIGADISWSANVRAALERIPQSYVLLLLEDLLLFDAIQVERLESALRWMIEADADSLKLNPFPPADGESDGRVGWVRPGAHYRVSTVATVWKKSVLLALLDDRETAWQFEINGSTRSNRYRGFYACQAPHFPVANAVVRGKWQRFVRHAALAAGAPVERETRPMMSAWETAAYALKVLRFRALQVMPARFRLRIRTGCGGA